MEQAWTGTWGYGHLRVAEKELLDVPAPLRERVLDDVMPFADTDHPRRLCERLRKSLAKRDAAGMADRMKERARERDVSLSYLRDGQARLAITGPYEAVNQASRQLTELAHARKAAIRGQDPGTSCTVGALRFDASMASIHQLHARLGPPSAGHPADGARRFADGESIYIGTSSDGGNVADPVHSGRSLDAGNIAGSIHSLTVHGPTGPGAPIEPDPWAIPRAGSPGSRPRQQASVIVDAATALHLAEEPGFVPGYGWVPAPIAREILADSTAWRRWLLDDSSRQLIEAGSTRYRPSEALRELIAGRDITCTADTCTRPASEAQVDHAIDFDGANTTPANLHVVCGPDHLAVTAGHFVIDADDAGRALWVSTGTGHAYPSHVEPLHERSEAASPTRE